MVFLLCGRSSARSPNHPRKQQSGSFRTNFKSRRERAHLGRGQFNAGIFLMRAVFFITCGHRRFLFPEILASRSWTLPLVVRM